MGTCACVSAPQEQRISSSPGATIEDDAGAGTVAMVDLKTSPFTKITETHSDYMLAVSIQNGLRGSISHAPPADLDNIENIDPRERAQTIRMRCNESTIHRFSSFKNERKEQLFIEYAPKSFSNLRKSFQITDDDYLSILTGDDQALLSFLSNSKSGQYFFFSNNSQFIIKTMSKSELDFLLQILPSYVDYMLNEPNSLIARFYGVYKLNKFQIHPNSRSNKDISFLISNNVFYSPRNELVIHKQYDLKGSTQGRLTAKEDARNGSILKDINFIEDNVILNISSQGRASLFHAQIKRDCEWFARNLIMDYSLLVGIANWNEMEIDPTDSAADSGSSSDTNSVGLRADSEEKSERTVESNGMASNSEGMVNVFCQDYGGMRSDDGNNVYFVGIIDILQKYNAKKKAAAFVKGIKYESQTLSTVPPDLYAKRFCDFFQDRVC